MFSKKCVRCGGLIKRSWRFCPNCGLQVAAQNMGINQINVDLSGNTPQDMAKIQRDMNKMVQQMISPILGNMMGSFFGKHQPQRKQSEKPVKNTADIEEVIEPRDAVSNQGGAVVHSISLPGVKSKQDISVDKLENSIEVRARFGKKLYLAIIKRDKKEGIISEQFENETLALVLKRI